MNATAEKPMTLAGSHVGQAPIRCPRWLTASAKPFWRELAPDLQRRGILTPLDRPLLAVLCELLATHRAATRVIEEDGLTLPSGELHPLAEVAAETSKQALAIAHDFGLTPLGRAELERMT